ncbi:MAG: hypothetical protein KKD39_04295 [Candidatus Altiarchaeota archaeon]|nr:hypothetical protein [Candidatus Altiarchaeota archaeon]
MKHLRIGFMIVLGLFLVFRYPLWEDHVAGGWDMCLTYLWEGTLFGGQPFCNQAPIIYYVGYVLNYLIGEYAFAGMAFLKLAAFVLAFKYLAELTTSLGVKNHFLDLFLFILFLYPYGANKPEVLLSSVFFLKGFLTLYSSKNPNPSAGVVFAISLFLKYTAAVPIIISGIYFLYIKEADVKRKIFDAILLATPTGVLTLVFLILHPGFFTYGVLAQTAEPVMSSLGSIALIFLSFNVHTIALILMILALAYVYLISDEAEKPIILVPLLTIPFVVFSMSRAWGFYHPPRYYALQVYPLLIASVHIFHKRLPKFFTLFVAVVFIYPSINDSGFVGSLRTNYFYDEIRQFNNVVSSGLSALPNPKKGILFESSREEIEYIRENGVTEFFKPFGWDIPSGDDRFIYSGYEFTGAEDPYWAKRLRDIENISYQPHSAFQNLSQNEVELKNEILSGKYDVMMYTAHSWIVLSRVFNDMAADEVSRFCAVFIPDFRQRGIGRSYSAVIYEANQSFCQEQAKAVASHYTKAFDEICSKSHLAAETTKLVMMQNQYLLKKTCNSKSKVTDTQVYTPKILDVILLALTYVLIHFTLGKKEKKPKSQKRIRSSSRRHPK